MFTRRFELFRFLGFPIRIDLSWLLIAFLVTWSLATGVFPELYEGLSGATYWTMGVLGALGLFVSILLHELAHAVVARRRDMPVDGITLFIFGGVAELRGDPPTAGAEFQVAIAGPIASVLIGAVCIAAAGAGAALQWPQSVRGVFAYLGQINLLLVVFNMIPAFPLDGGRVLRAGLWHWKGDVRRATSISAQVGAGFGLALIGLGVFSFIMGSLIGGMWFVLIGMFLRSAAKMSLQQTLVREALHGEPVRHLMRPAPETIHSATPLSRMVDEHIYREDFEVYPVADNGALLGCVTRDQVRDVPSAEWSNRTVGELIADCPVGCTVSPEADAMEALIRMQSENRNRLLVVEADRLVGELRRADLARYVSFKLEGDQAIRKAGPPIATARVIDEPRR